MLARSLPTPQEAATARRILLNGLGRDAELYELAGALAPLHPLNCTFLGEVFLHVAADVLDRSLDGLYCCHAAGHSAGLDEVGNGVRPRAMGADPSSLIIRPG